MKSFALIRNLITTARSLSSAGLAAGLIAFSMLAAACSARNKPSALETKLANAAKDVVIPLEAESARNPTPDSALTLAQGRQVYESHCALCHGEDGHSQVSLGLAMNPPAMDLTSPHVQSWKDPELYWIVQNGIRLTGMPSWQGILNARQTWDLARYIHALPTLTPQLETALDAMLEPPSADASGVAYGKRLIHQEGCLMCHRYNGEGEDVGPDLTHEAARRRSADWLIGHFRDPEAYSKDSMMPAFKNLTRAQLAALVALLQAK